MPQPFGPYYLHPETPPKINLCYGRGHLFSNLTVAVSKGMALLQ